MKQKILVSVDTEAPVGKNAVDTMIYCKTDSGEYGIKYLFDLFDEYGIKALFFVDIAEIVDHGEDNIRKVIRDIDLAGHDVGVHVHPDHMLDSRRRYLWQYSKEEQYNIISKCTDFYINVLGRRPYSFRAGRYGANNDTLDVLVELGYKYDMSGFYRSRYCKFEPHFTCNRMKRYKDSDLIEVPITTYKSFYLPFYERNDQIAPELGALEFRKVLDGIVNSGKADVISLLFHSFQFVDWRNNPDHPVFNKKKLKLVRKNMDYIRNYGLDYISEEQLKNVCINEEYDIGDINLSKGILPVAFFIKRAIHVLHDRMVLNV